MAAALLFKVRCPECGKSLRVQREEAGGQIVCRACGIRIEVPPAPLLAPLTPEIPSLQAVSARSLLEPLAADLRTDASESPATWTFQPAVDGTTAGHVAEAVGQSGAAQVAPMDSAPVETPSDLPPWAAVTTLPDTPPPPANPVIPGTSAATLAAAPRLVVARLEGPDPDEVSVRLGQVPPYVSPPAMSFPSIPLVRRAVPPMSPQTPFDPLADTAVLPAISAVNASEIDHSPTAEDIRTVLAAHRAGHLRLVDGHHRHGHPFWWALLGMMSATAIILIALAATGQINWFDPWEKQIYPTVAQYKAEAEALAVRGSLAAAHERYQKIDQLVAGREIRDPHLREVVESGRTNAQQIVAVLLSQLSNPAATAPTTPLSATETPAQGNGQEPIALALPIPPTTPSSVPPPESASTMPASPVSDAQPEVDAEPEVKPTPVKPRRPAPVVVEAPARRGRPALRPVVMREDGPITDEAIGAAIQAGVDYLLKQFDNQTHVIQSRDRGNDLAYRTGLDALAVYALLQAGQAIEDPRISHRGTEMKAKLEALRNLPIDGNHQTYARGLRATCLALFNRGEDFKVMANDVDWLLGTTDGGAYTYSGDYRTIAQRGNYTTRSGGWDNSNSQYGVLGVWSGIEADPRIEVPLAYWKAVERHWTSCQSPDGQWGYGEGGSGGRLTMTSAGIASLFVAHEYLDPASAGASVGREPFSPALKKALAWFERGNNSVNVRGGNWWGYSLYGIERVGLASGFKHFGQHDWYRELSEQIVKRQLSNGAWGDGPVDTSYALLFLSRGRHPILMNKLRFDGYWANRPRDASNMARYAGRQFERPINWQVVNVENPWTDWTDSPILYIASHEPPALTDEHVEKLRRFVRSGGMIFTHADAGSPKFDKWARELAAKLFTYEMTELPEHHPLWSSVYKLTARPPLWGVSNGSRLLLLHSPTDISLRWQQRTDRTFETRPGASKPGAVATPDSETKTRMLSPFYFGMNLFVYAAGKRDLRNRLDSAWIEPPKAPPIDTIAVARLQYGGNWDPEPGAWERYANWFHRTTGTRLDVRPIWISELNRETVQQFPMAHLTGTARSGFTDNDAAALRAYVEAGGVVLIEPTGGMNAFDNEVRESLLMKVFPDRFLRLLDAGHPLMTKSAPGMEDVSKTIVRGYTLERLGGGIGTIQMVTPKSEDATESDARRTGAIIVTSLDLTSGLLGTNVWGVLGFQNSYAQSFVKNAIFWTVDGRPQ